MEHVFSNKEATQRNDFSPKTKTPVQQQGNLGQAVQMAKTNPAALTSGNIVQMQKALGNKAVTQLLSEHAVQRAKNPEEEEPLQGKFQTVQKKGKSPEEEEPLQGKFKTAQKKGKSPEEEEPLQGKFQTVQKKGKSPEEEEPLQGKFLTIQRSAPEEEEVQT